MSSRAHEDTSTEQDSEGPQELALWDTAKVHAGKWVMVDVLEKKGGNQKQSTSVSLFFTPTLRTFSGKV